MKFIFNLFLFLLTVTAQIPDTSVEVCEYKGNVDFSFTWSCDIFRDEDINFEMDFYCNNKFHGSRAMTIDDLDKHGYQNIINLPSVPNGGNIVCRHCCSLIGYRWLPSTSWSIRDFSSLSGRFNPYCIECTYINPDTDVVGTGNFGGGGFRRNLREYE